MNRRNFIQLFGIVAGTIPLINLEAFPKIDSSSNVPPVIPDVDYFSILSRQEIIDWKGEDKLIKMPVFKINGQTYCVKTLSTKIVIFEEEIEHYNKCKHFKDSVWANRIKSAVKDYCDNHLKFTHIMEVKMCSGPVFPLDNSRSFRGIYVRGVKVRI